MKTEILNLTKDCYKNIEKAEVLINILHEKYLTEKDTVVILEIISANIKNLTNLILEIQDAAK